MNEMTLLERMEKLLPHWNEHLQSHVADLEHWRLQSGEILDQQALLHLKDAEDKMQQACDALGSAFAIIAEEAEAGIDSPPEEKTQ